MRIVIRALAALLCLAAAPDMLAALEDALDSLLYVQSLGREVSGWGVRQERINAARDAIAKARGEGR